MKRIIVALSTVLVFLLSYFSLSFAAEIESGQYVPSVFPTTKTITWKEWGEEYGVPKSSTTTLSILHSDPQLNGDDALYIDTLLAPQDYYQFMNHIKFNYGDTIELEAKVRLDAFSGNELGACHLIIETDRNDAALIILPDRVWLYPSYASYAMNTMDTYHVYRVVTHKHNIKVYIDGSATPLLDAPFDSSFGGLRSEVQFGDTAGGGGAKSAWAYVKYRLLKKNDILE